MLVYASTDPHSHQTCKSTKSQENDQRKLLQTCHLSSAGLAVGDRKAASGYSDGVRTIAAVTVVAAGAVSR